MAPRVRLGFVNISPRLTYYNNYDNSKKFSALERPTMTRIPISAELTIHTAGIKGSHRLKVVPCIYTKQRVPGRRRELSHHGGALPHYPQHL